MTNLLDVVITHWNESWDVGKNAIRMLAMQRRVDWRIVHVMIVHDGSEAFPDEYFEDCAFPVEQVCLPHGGISAARNYAIDHSDAQWIKFCDFDDMFAGVFSLSCITDGLIDAHQYDMLWFPLIIDVYSGPPIIDDCSPVFIHDKIFSVPFLKAKNIRFNENLTYSEDFAFMSLLKLEINDLRIGRINSNFPIYMYILRPGSIGNRSDMWFKNRCGHFDAHCYVEGEMRRHGKLHDADSLAVRTMAECYYVLKKANPNTDTSEYEQRMWEFYDSHRDSFRHLNDSDIDYVVEQTNKQNRSDITTDEFLAWVGEHDA